LVSAVDRIEITVSDLTRARAFYESVLGARARALPDDESALSARAAGVRRAKVRRVQLSLGDERVVLSEYEQAASARPVPPDTRGNDLWFQHVAIVVSDMDRAYAWLRARGVQHVSSGPQTLPSWNRAAAGIRAFYFADEDGHALELIQFPRGKGAARWHAPRRCERVPVEHCLFLGVDHTAITVSDTEQSLAFYRDAIGLRVTGESENHGPEQEHLNAVFGARLRITGLAAASGPGIELLEYLSPRGGRRAPSDARPSDLFHYHVGVVAQRTSDVVKAAARLGQRVEEDRATATAFVRDPDGHALFVEESSRR
jgi:catechol 2,3-dioxygenase-like lactoylglutathione lyase family enzyme